MSSSDQTTPSSLLESLALPPTKRDTLFVSTFVKDAALESLQSIIWDVSGQSSSSQLKNDKVIKTRVLHQAERLVSSPPGLDVRTLLDIAIVYAPTKSSRIRALFTAALKSNPSLTSAFESELVPAFTSLLSPPDTSGLYNLRKISHCISCLFHVSPPEAIRPFARNKAFFLALAHTYGEGLATIAHSYGGVNALQSPLDREPDEWERIWVETKVSLMDAFHLLLKSLLKDISDPSGADVIEHTFDVIFSLLDLPPSFPALSSAPQTPFLNRSILADYQQSYDLSSSLTASLHYKAEKDSRLDVLESMLRALESTPSQPSRSSTKNTGVLSFLLRSSGIPPGINHLGKGNLTRLANKNKGKATPKNGASPLHSRPLSPATTSQLSNLDSQVSQVLDILPGYSPEYIRALLVNPAYPFKGSAEKVVEALLEGTAPAPEELQDPTDELVYVKERVNVFDNQDMDLSKVHIGKKSEAEAAILQDRTFIEQMKADILRRAEEISDDDDDEADNKYLKQKGKEKSTTVAFEEEIDLDGSSQVKVLGDGEGSDEYIDGSDDSNEDQEPPPTSRRDSPETILELAYIRDPKLFERDAQTRRSKSRADLKLQTGWLDEQIEGWKIMLERNPKKDKILQKHEFAGNRATMDANNSAISSTNLAPSGSGARERGGQHERGSRGGGNRGRGAAPSADDGSNARERSWNNKNKASRGNHNRKRGHDKKMARAGAPS